MQAETENMCFYEVEGGETSEPPAKKYCVHPGDVLNSFGAPRDCDPDAIVKFVSTEPHTRALAHQLNLNYDEQIISCEGLAVMQKSSVNFIHQSSVDANDEHKYVEKCVENKSSVSSVENTSFAKPNVDDQLGHRVASHKDNVSNLSTPGNLSESTKNTPGTFVLQKSDSETCNNIVTCGGTSNEISEPSCNSFSDSHFEQTVAADKDKKEFEAATHSSIQKLPFKDDDYYAEHRQMLLNYENFRSKETQLRDLFDGIFSKMPCTVREMHPSSECFFLHNNSVRKPLGMLKSQAFVYPPPDLLNMILWTLVEEPKDNLTSYTAVWYVTRLLDVHPPNRRSHTFYYKVLFDGKRFMWEEISQIIQSSLQACGVYDGKCSYDGGCDFLRIFVNILTKDFEAAKLKDFVNVGRIDRQAFAAVLFFIPENLALKKLQSLLRFINDLVRPSLDEKQVKLLKILLRLLHLLAETARLKYTCHETRALYCAQLNFLTNEICVHCRDTLGDVRRSRIFLDMLSPLWLKIKIGESLLAKVVLQTPLHFSEQPMTLRKIVRQYIFPPSEQLLLAKENLLSSESSNNGSSMCVSRIMKPNPKGESLIHVKCRQNKPEELKEILSVPGIDINMRDHAGWTALHECCNCKSNCYDCAKLLVTWFPPEEIFVTVFADHLTAVDLSASCGGVTPLHEAVASGHENIVELLLEYGGPLLINVRDNEGKTPQDLAVDRPHLKDILERAKKNTAWKTKNRFDDESFNFDGDLSYSKRVCPKLRSSADYSYYAYLLSVLLETYLRFTQLHSLQEYVHKNCSAGDFRSCIEKFLKNSGCTPSFSDIVNCLDDLFVLKRLPEVLKTLSYQVKAAGIADETQELFMTLEFMCLLL